MNHLKHIRGISVRASSNAALPSHYGQHADVCFENRKLKCQLLRSNPLSVAKKNHGIDVRYSGQFRQDSLRLVSKESKTICKQRNKTKSSVTSLKMKSSVHKKLPSENTAKRVCHYSTCQNAKFNSDEINKQLMPQSHTIINSAKNINRHSSFIASVEKHPRSYAEMIADYSESLYKESTVATRNDSFHFNNAIRKSPFSTFSVSSPAKTIVNVVDYSELSTKRQKNDFFLPAESSDLCNRYNNINTIECYDFQHHGMCTAETTNKYISQNGVTTNDLRRNDQSYAKLVADCSKSMHNIPITTVLNDGLVPKRKVLARNSFESVTTPRKDKSTYTQNKSREITPTANTMPSEKNIKGQVIDLKENDWLREMEDVMSDLKSVAEKKVAKSVPKIKERDIQQPVEVSGNLLDRIHGFAEYIKSSKQKEKDTTISRKLNYQSTKIDRIEKRKKNFELQKHNYSLLSDKTSNLPQYFGNAAESSAIRKNSTHVSTSGNTDVLKQPQVKLRMVPSEKESIVSINVDQASIGSLDASNSTSKHLSVVVQSDQKEDPQLTNNQWNAQTLRRTTKSALQRSDFGPMHISISEDSAPIKQIEFSINGKPVSELKSITARTERLDVVSSVDKIEIRIPFAKDDSNALNNTRENLSKGTNSNTGQILNVQISANFQDESTKGSSAETSAKAIRYQYDKDTIPKSSSSFSKTPYLSSNFSKTREETLNKNNIQQNETSKQMDIKFNDKKYINKNKISGDVDLNIRRKAMKNALIGEATTYTSKEANNVEVGSLNMRKANIIGFPEANKYNKNESSDNRVPSKIIPWWSSSDSFNKIKKKEDDHTPLMPPSNRNDHKAVSNLNQNLTTKTLLSKPKEISNSKILTKKTQSKNNATTSDSCNIFSYSNSIRSYEESKPTFHYACSYRLKPNQENSGIIPEIIRNGLKAEDNQSTANKDINKISGVKQTKSTTLFKSDTMNIKGNHDISIGEKTSVLQRKIKTPSSAQNLSPKKNQEKKNNYSLKQTKSIDDVSKNIQSKIKDILDAIKPIEKKDDGLLVDYSLKREMLSKKPNVILNSGVSSPSPVMTTKDLISNSSTTEIVSKKIDKTKQTESTKEKLKTKMNIFLKEKDLKNVTTTNIKALNKNDVKNIKEGHKNDFMSSSSSTFRNSPEFTQTLEKQEQLADDSISFQSKQNLRSLLEADKNGISSSLNMRISSGTMQRSEKLGISGRVLLEESKQNRPKSLTSVKNTPETNEESEKLKGLTSSKLANPFKEPSDTRMINKLPLQTIKQIQSQSSKNKISNINKLSSPQTISNSTLKIKDRAISKNAIDKNISETSVTQSLKTKRTDMEDMIARIVTQNPKNKDPLSKNCEENFKSGLGKGNFFGSSNPSRKPNNSVSFKSAGSKTKSRVMSNNNCIYNRKLLMESFYLNFNRKNNIMSNSQSAIFKVRQNLSDVDMLEHPVPTAIGRDGSWINMDRPEKSMLYSAWLQRSENDIKKNGKLC